MVKLVPAEKIGNFRFQVDTNHDGTKFYVSYKEGLFGTRFWITFDSRYYDSDDYGSYNRPKAFRWTKYEESVSESLLGGALNYAREEARNTIKRREEHKKASIRRTIHKEP